MTVKKRGLGRGLDALLSSIQDSQEQPLKQPSELQQLPIEQVQPSPYQPRRTFQIDALEELAASIRVQGIIQPVVVRKTARGHFELVAGERRWRAAQMAGLDTIPALVRNITDEAAMAIALIENIQRKNLNAIEEAAALQRLLEEFQMTHQQVADSVGKSRTAITNLLRLLSLNDDVKGLLEKSKLEMGHARALLGLAGKAQSDAAQTVANKQLSVRDTENLVRKLQTTPSASVPTKPQDPDISRLQNQLAEHFAAEVMLQHGSKGKGKLILHYNSLAELDGILQTIGIAKP
jgi:ParB family chromosome partitioning protein